MQLAGPISYGVKGSISTAVAVTATSTPLNQGVYVQNTGSAVVYIGDSAVTTSTGFPLAANATSPLIPINDPSKLFVVCATSGAIAWIGG